MEYWCFLRQSRLVVSSVFSQDAYSGDKSRYHHELEKTAMQWTSFSVLAVLAGNVHAAPVENHWTSTSKGNAQTDYAKADALIDAEQYADALSLLTGLSEEQPGFADIWSLLGFAYRKIGELEESSKAYRRALGLDPYHLGALEYQGELFLMLGDVERAEANLRRLEMLCGSGCEELDELTDQISLWRAQQDK